MEHDRSRSRPGTDGPRTLVVHDDVQAALLLDPRTMRQLEPFLAEPRTVSEAAEALGELPNTVLKRVRRFVAAELLEVASIRPRRGRPVRRYRTVADVFFVPFEAGPAEGLEEALAEREAPYERLLRRNVVQARREALGPWGTRIYRDDRGRLQVQMAVRPDANATTLEPGGPAVLSAWRDRLQLDYDDAKALQRELFGLLSRYQKKRGGQRYVVHVGLAPVVQDADD